jgi:hypothetical protein
MCSGVSVRTEIIFWIRLFILGILFIGIVLIFLIRL